jgi:type II secretory pathway component PulM
MQLSFLALGVLFCILGIAYLYLMKVIQDHARLLRKSMVEKKALRAALAAAEKREEALKASLDRCYAEAVKHGGQ